MIDVGILTWTQQWEFWLFSRILRPMEFGNLWRWDFLLIPDQVWLLVGAYRAIRHLFVAEGSLWTRFLSLGGFMRTDPIIFLAFGLMFVAEPHLRRRRQLVDGAALMVDPEDALVDAGDIDEVILEEEEDQVDQGHVGLNQEYAHEIEESQSANAVVIPATALRRCKCCGSDRAVATNLLVGCGHFPFCNPCVRKEGFACTVCVSKGVKIVGSPNAVGMTSSDLVKAPTHSRSCPVCQEREGLLSLMPCGHLLFCGPCVLGLKKCPYCSSKIARAVRGFDVRHNDVPPTR
jgi:hypothetical protein